MRKVKCVEQLQFFYFFNLFVWLKVLEEPMLVPLETYPRGPRVDIRDRGQKGEDPL